MTRDEQLAFCRICKNQKSDNEKGIICGITNEKATFEEKCDFYIEDADLKERQREIMLQHQTFMKTASQGKRLANFILDYIFFYIFCIILGVFLGVIIVIVSPSSTSFFDNDSKIVNYLLGLFLGMIYYSTYEAITGRTLAKYITKTKVVTVTGEQPNYKTILIRTICRFIPFEPFSFLFGDSGWHDRLSDTMVIDA